MAATYLFVPLNFSLAKPGRTIYARGSLIIRRRHGRKGARFIAPCKIATAALVEKKMKKVVPGLIVLAIVIIGILGALTIESYLHPKITLRTQIQSPPQSLPAVPPQKVEEDLAAAPSTSATEPPSTDTTTTQIVLGPLITPPEEKPAIPVETKPQPAEAEIITDQMPTEEEATSTQAPTAGMGLLTDTGETAEASNGDDGATTQKRKAKSGAKGRRRANGEERCRSAGNNDACRYLSVFHPLGNP